MSAMTCVFLVYAACATLAFSAMLAVEAMRARGHVRMILPYLARYAAALALMWPAVGIVAVLRIARNRREKNHE